VESHLLELDPLEQSKHLITVDSSVEVSVGLLGDHLDLAEVVGRIHAHVQTEIPVGEVKLLPFQFPGSVHVVLHENGVHVVPQHLVVHAGVPASLVVNCSHLHASPILLLLETWLLEADLLLEAETLIWEHLTLFC
jgi:hypothetical protein